MRASSGVPGFDALVDGGFPENRLYVVSGPRQRENDVLLAVRRAGRPQR